MASEDVIELGSSDDEVEPPPKRKKSIPNAMVHIPTHLPGVTIKPTTSKGAGRTGLPKILPKGEAVTVTKVAKVVNPLSIANKSNGRTIKKPDRKPSVGKIIMPNSNSIVKKAPNIQGLSPVNLLKKINSQVVINKVPVNKMTKPLVTINTPTKINTLPPSITVKRGPGLSGPTLPQKQFKSMRRAIHIKNTSLGMKVVNNKKPITVLKKKVSNEVLTVDLDDDDDTDASSSSRQWYLRPEQADKPSQEEENNKEPDKAKYIEITIEDSPVKPKPAKVIEELSFTIEDSPVKPHVEKENAMEAKSDEERVDNKCKTPLSKKRLQYPKQDQDRQVVEIEIEPIAYKESTDVDTAQVTQKDKESIMVPDIVEIEESPLKEANVNITSTPKKNHSRPPVKFTEEKTCDNSPENSEFHPVYQNFIKTCFEIENSEDMQKIVDKKVKTYYRQVPKDYTESEQFIDMVTSKILAMKASPDKMYLFIKDIVDELNLQRKMAKAQPAKSEKEIAAAAESENFLYGENSEFDSKRQRQIRKLEKTLKKLHRAIQKLEEQEVDFDDEEDSVYLLTERYKERMMRVHAKFCQLTNTKMPSEPKVHLEPRPGHPSGPAKRLEKWINKKVPIGTPLPFPDFHDVLRCVKEANEEDKLGWNDVDVMEEARDLFVRCGKKLQRRRQENEWRTAVSRINLDADPAENSEELTRKLALNKQLASKKEVEVFNKFADKQNQLNLEAEEIGDKEAEESPVESEEEVVDEESLENKDKRKERLRRLLQEKSKKSTDEKENEPTEKENLQTTEEIKESVTNKESEKKSSDDDSKKDNKIEEKVPELVENDTNKNNQDTKTDETNDRLESDIDELHLLQKLYSENEVNTSTVDSSDSDAPISISDTLDSDNADKKSVISIENSSYSESEINKDAQFETDLEKGVPDSENTETVSIPGTEIIKESIDTNIEIECSESGVQKKHVQSNNDEYNESVEDILLASSDDESTGNDAPCNEENVLSSDNPGSVELVETEVVENPESNEATVNLRDDNLSIGETIVGDDSLEQPAENSPLDDKGSDQTGSNTNMEVVNDVSENISSNADTPMQTDAIEDPKEGNDDIADRVTATNDKLAFHVEVVTESMSLDDDSFAWEEVEDKDYGSNSVAIDCDKDSLSDPKSGSKNHCEMVSTARDDCSIPDGDNVNDKSSEKVNERMVVDDEITSNFQSETSRDNVLKEPKLTEGLSA